MSPTVFRFHSYRFYFFSREEKRIDVHVICPDGESKFWLEPEVILANSVGLSKKQVSEIEKLIQEHKDEIKTAWKRYFGS